MIPLPVHRLHSLLFDDKSDFFGRFHAEQDDLNYRAEPWVQRPSAPVSRNVTYSAAISAVISAASHAECIETQSYVRREDYMYANVFFFDDILLVL